jgi:hypothetical protein
LLSVLAALATEARLHLGLPPQQAVGTAVDLSLQTPQQTVVLAVVVLVVQTTALVFPVRDTLAVQTPAQTFLPQAVEVAVALVAASLPLAEEMVALLRRSLVLLLRVAVAVGPTMTEQAVPVVCIQQQLWAVAAGHSRHPDQQRELSTPEVAAAASLLRM